MPKQTRKSQPGSGMVAVLLAMGGLALGGLGASGCATSKKDVRKAKSSAYDADFALVFETVGKVVRKEYPHGQDDAVQGTIKTAWHVVQGVREEAPPNPGYAPDQPGLGAVGGGDPASSNEQRSRMATRNAHARGQDQSKNYFVRFDVFVEGKRPFRVRVVGHASEQDAGMAPRPLEGDERPYWLPERENTLAVAIYEALEDFAVPIPGEDAPGNATASQ